MSNPSVGSYWWMVESPVAPWNGAQTLLRVHALNERCLEILAHMARMDRERIGLDIVNLYRSQWRGLNATGRKCAARTPFLLVDIHLHDADWWRWARTPRLIRRRDTVRHAAFGEKTAGELMRETLMLAWSTVAFDRGAASVLLGMTSPVCTIIADLTPQDVDRITARYSRHLRPRWENLPTFWGSLLAAARNEDEEGLHYIHLRGTQLLGSELLPLARGKPS